MKFSPSIAPPDSNTRTVMGNRKTAPKDRPTKPTIFTG